MTNPAEDPHDSPLADCHHDIAVTPEATKDHAGEEDDEDTPKELTWQEEHENKLRDIISNQRKLLSQILPPMELDETRVDSDAYNSSKIAYSARMKKTQNTRQSRLGRRSKSVVSLVLAEKEHKEPEEVCDDVIKSSQKAAKSNNANIRNKRSTMKNRRSKSFISIALSEKEMKELQEADQEVGEDSPKSLRWNSARLKDRRNTMKNRRSKSFIALTKPSADPDRLGFPEIEPNRYDNIGQALGSLAGEGFNPDTCYGFNSSSSSLLSQSDLSPHRSSNGSSGGDGPRRRVQKSFSDRSLNSTSGGHSVGDSPRKIEKSISGRSIGSTSEKRRLTKSKSLRLSSRHELDTNAQKEQGKDQNTRTSQSGHMILTKRRGRGRSSTRQSLSTKSSLSNLTLGVNTSTLKGGRSRRHGSLSPLPPGKKDPLVSLSDQSSCSKRGRRSTSGSEHPRRRAKSKPETNRSPSCADELKESLSLLVKTPKRSNTKRDKLSRSKSEGGLLLELPDDTSNSRHGGWSKGDRKLRAIQNGSVEIKAGGLSSSDHTPRQSNRKKAFSRSQSEAGLLVLDLAKQLNCEEPRRNMSHASSFVNRLDVAKKMSDLAPERKTSVHDDIIRRLQQKVGDKKKSKTSEVAPGATWESRSISQRLSKTDNGGVSLRSASCLEISTSGLTSSEHSTPRHSNKKDALSRSKSEAGLLIVDLAKQHSHEEPRRDSTHVNSFANRLDMSRRLSKVGPERKTSVHEDVIQHLQKKVGDKKKSNASSVVQRNSTQGALLRIAGETSSISMRLSQSGSVANQRAHKQKVSPSSGKDRRKSSDPKPRPKRAIMAMEPDDADVGTRSAHGRLHEDNGPSISQLAGLLNATRGLQVGKEGTKVKKRVYHSAGDLQRLVSGVNQHTEKGNSRRNLIMSQTKLEERLSLPNARKEEAARAG